MKETSVIKRMLALGTLAVLLTACGGAGAGSASLSHEGTAQTAAYDTAAPAGGFGVSSGAKAAYEEELAVEDSAYDYAEAAAEEPADEGGYEQNAAPETAAERKLIKTVNIYAETEAFDSLIPELQRQVEALGGYIENISVYDINSYYVEERLVKQRGADMTARVPKEKLDGFLSQVAEQANVTSRSESVEDVTLQYVDLESHKKALLTEQERLLELMEGAESVEDIIAIEGRLSEVRYQLESMESQLRTYDNRIDYSTVCLSIQEVRKYTAPYDASAGERIASGFVKSLEDIGYSIRDFAVGFVIDIPYIILWIVIIAVALVVLRLLRKVWKKHAAKRREAYGENGTEQGTGRMWFRRPGVGTQGKEEPENRKMGKENDDK